MRIINRGRGTGKTSMLVSTAYVTDTPIVVATESAKDDAFQTAKKLGINPTDVAVFTLSQWMSKKEYSKRFKDVLVDDANLVLQTILEDCLNANVTAVTMTVPQEDIQE